MVHWLIHHTSLFQEFHELFGYMRLCFQSLWRWEIRSEPCQTSKMACSAKRAIGRKPITNFPQRSILDFWQGSEYPSDRAHPDPSSCWLCTIWFLYVNQLCPTAHSHATSNWYYQSSRHWNSYWFMLMSYYSSGYRGHCDFCIWYC